MVKTKRLTIRERKFIKGLGQGLTGAEAARQAGYSERRAKEAACEVVTKRNVQASLQELMEAKGLNDGQILDDLGEGLQANKVIGYLNQKNKQGKRIEPDEVVSNDYVEVPDWGNRHKYLNTELELLGHINKGKGNGASFTNIIITDGAGYIAKLKSDNPVSARAETTGIPGN